MNEDGRDALRDARTQRVPPTEELRALTRQLFARALRRDAWILRRENFEGARILECCNNALAWVEAHPGHLLVYGFLYADFGLQLTHVRFIPHCATGSARSPR